MSGSLAHLIGQDGRLTFDNIGCMKDAGMALRQCYNIIATLAGGNMDVISDACTALGYVDPYETDRYDDDPMPGPMLVSDV